MFGVLKEGNERAKEIVIGDYKLNIIYQKPEKPYFGIIIQTAEDEFLVIGMNLKISFESSTVGYMGLVWEGRFENQKCIPTRFMNGDETFHNAWLRVFGRTFETTQDIVNMTKKAGEHDAYSPATKQSIVTPGVYKVITYER